MKTLHIIPSLRRGGLQSFALDLCHNLASKNNCEVTILVLDLKANASYKLSSLPCRFIFMDQTSSVFNLVSHLHVFSLVAQLNPDIIHTHGIALWYCTLLLPFLDSPIVHTLHNLAERESGFVRRKFNQVLFSVGRVFPVTISSEVDTSFVQCYGDIARQLIVNGILHPVKSDKFNQIQSFFDSVRSSSSTRVLVNVGRIDLQKNQELLLRSFVALRKQSYDVALILLGQIVDADVAALIKNLESSFPIYCLGPVENVYDYLLCSDIFCLTSIFEGMPISLLEALSAGLPCVCTPAGGISSALACSSSIVSDDFSLESYTKSLLAMLRKLPFFQSSTSRTLYSKYFTMDICSSKYNLLYQRLLAC